LAKWINQSPGGRHAIPAAFSASCGSPWSPSPSPRRGGGTPPWRRRGGGEVRAEPVVITAPDAGECATDEDCVLLPVLSCCGECPPAAPFEALTRAELDAELIVEEEHCAREDHDCAEHACEPLPAGCRPRAACVATRCEVVAPGC
jgi:hypothetical protein